VDGFFFTKIEDVDIFVGNILGRLPPNSGKNRGKLVDCRQTWKISMVDLEGNSAIKPSSDEN